MACATVGNAASSVLAASSVVRFFFVVPFGDVVVLEAEGGAISVCS